MATYSRGTIIRMAAEAGFRFQSIDWLHPAQRWALFAKPEFDDEALELNSAAPHWNRFLNRELDRGSIDGVPKPERMDFVD